MWTIDDYFNIFQFLKDNPDATITSDFSDQTFLYGDSLVALQNSLNLVSPGEVGLSIEEWNEIQTALESRGSAINYFENILRQLPFNTADYRLMEKLLIDWYSSNKTLIDIMRKSTDAFALSSEHVDLAIRGFGAEIINERVIPDKYTRALFLLALAHLYKIKGSPESITTALNFIGYRNATLREWWIKRHPKFRDDLQLEGIAIDKGSFFDETKQQYKPINAYDLEPEIISWQTFQSRLWQIGDPHWQYTKEEIIAIDNVHDNVIRLPSLTPYFSISVNVDIQQLNQLVSVLEKLLVVEFNNFINCRTLSRNTYIEGYTAPVSYIELYLAFTYAQVRADDASKYNHFFDYLKSSGIEPQEFSHPHSYEKLIYWASDSNNVPNYIVNGYVPNDTLYYGATNQLHYWWVTEEGKLWNDIPDIYFTVFHYDRNLVDYANEEIFFYSGTETTEIVEKTDFDKIFEEYNNLLNASFNRDTLNETQQYYNDVLYTDVHQSGDEGFSTPHSIWGEGSSSSSSSGETQFGYPVLDLTNRYNSERILRGSFPVSAAQDLDNIENPFEGQTVLVCNTDTTRIPTIYEYKEGIISSSSSSTSIGLAWLPSDKNINQANLGLNNELINWIDERVSSGLTYAQVADQLLLELSSYIGTKIRSTNIDLAGIYQRLKSSDAFWDIIKFFKPKRVRLLYFVLAIMFDDRLFNSLVYKDEVDIKELGQTNRDYVPHDDMIYIHPERGLFNNAYHWEDLNWLECMASSSSSSGLVENCEPSKKDDLPYTEGVYNNWNEVRPRDPNIKASVPPHESTSKNWAFGFCIDYPRIIFPSGILGAPETIEGNRLLPFDENSETAVGEPFWAPTNNTTEYDLPIHHRPVFIATKEIVAECYPNCNKICCDYYDIGCNHDGEGNLHYDRWTGSGWVALPEAMVQLEEYQRNAGDTYCTECDSTLFTPDLAVLGMPQIWLDAGIYHDILQARGFEGANSWVNGTWYKASVTTRPDQFIYGYVKCVEDSSSSSSSIVCNYNYELVHIYNRSTGFHYWEVKDTGTTIIRSGEKKTGHSLDDLNRFSKIEPDDYLNTHDLDVAEDDWKDISGGSINGNFSSSVWIRYQTQVTWDPSIVIQPGDEGLPGDLQIDGSYLYICISINTWVRIQIEREWTDETFITPNSDRNVPGYVFKYPYLYTYLDTDNFTGWVRNTVSATWTTGSILPSSPGITGRFTYDNPYIYYFVMSNDQDQYICGDILPLRETYRGVWEENKEPGDLWCTGCSVWDSIDHDSGLGGFNGTTIQITKKDAIRRILRGTWNIWELFEPGQNQEATWFKLEPGEVDEITWGILEVDLPTGYELILLPEEWDGIRSNIYSQCDPSSSSSSSCTQTEDSYLYWYNFLSQKYPQINWPPFEPRLHMDSDPDYWNVYDKVTTTLTLSDGKDHIRGNEQYFEGINPDVSLTEDYVTGHGMLRTAYHDVPPREIFHAVEGGYAVERIITIENDSDGLEFHYNGETTAEISDLYVQEWWEEGSSSSSASNNLIDNFSNWETDGYASIGLNGEIELGDFDSTPTLEKFYGQATYTFDPILEPGKSYKVSFVVTNPILTSYFTMSMGGVPVIETDQYLMQQLDFAESDIPKGVPPFHMDYMDIFDADPNIAVYDFGDYNNPAPKTIWQYKVHGLCEGYNLDIPNETDTFLIKFKSACISSSSSSSDGAGTYALVTIEDERFNVGDVGEQFVWDIGGSREHIFIDVGEKYDTIINNKVYRIIWHGPGCHYFTTEYRYTISLPPIVSSSSSAAPIPLPSISSSSSAEELLSSSSSSAELESSSSSSSIIEFISSSSSSSSVAALISSSSSIQQPLTYWSDDPYATKLIAHWTFENDEDPPDYSGTENHLQLLNNPSHETDNGIFSCAKGHYYLDDVDDWMETKNNFTELTNISGSDLPFTLSFWAKIPSGMVAGARLFSCFDNGVGKGLDIRMDRPYSFRIALHSGPASYISSNWNLSSYINQWHHYVIVYDGSETSNSDTFKLYVDRKLLTASITSGGTYGGLPTMDRKFEIGRDVSLPYLWKGDIDEIRIYKDAEFSESQIQDMYNFYMYGGVCSLTYWPEDPHSDDLVGHWQLDSFYDYSGNDYHGVWYNNPTHKTSGGPFPCSDSYYEFDGIDDYGIIPSSDVWDMTDGISDVPYTMSFWAKIPSSQPATMYLFYHFNSPQTTGWSLQVQSGSLVWGLESISANSIENYYDTTAYEDVWHHFTFTYDGTKNISGMRMYADGSLITPDSQVGTTYNGQSQVNKTLNISDPSTSLPYIGDIDEIRIYKGSEFSACEVQELYKFYKNKICPPLSHWVYDPYNSKLVGWWTFDSNVLHPVDYSGNEHHAERVNGVTYKTIPEAFDTGEGFMEFDGTDDVIKVVTNVYDVCSSSSSAWQPLDFDFGNGGTDIPFTISWWMYYKSYAGRQDIIGKYDGTNGYYISILNNNPSLLQCRLYDGSTSIGKQFWMTDDLDRTKYLNTWAHYVVTYDGSKNVSGLQLYINGIPCHVENYLGTTYSGMTNSSTDLLFGADDDTSPNYSFDGYLDEIKVYRDVALDEYKVFDLYTHYVPEVGSSTSSSIGGSEETPLSYWSADPHGNKLIAHYTFDENTNAIDYSGQNNHAISYNDPQHQTAGGAFPCAYGHYNFDGINDYLATQLNFPNLTDSNNDFNPFTISFWTTLNDTGDGYILRHSGHSTDPHLSIYMSSTLDKLTISIPGGCSVDYSVSSYYNQWNHYVFTYDGSDSVNGFELYINGSLITPTSRNGTYSSLTYAINDKLYIGAQNSWPSPTSFYIGELDEIRIYNEAEFSASQVQNMYQFYMYEICLSSSSSSSSGLEPEPESSSSISSSSAAWQPLTYWPDDPYANKLIAHWTFENDEDPLDYSGEENHAKLINTPTYQTEDDAFPCAYGHYNFDGTDDYIQTKNNFTEMTNISETDLPFTLSFWAKTDNSSSATRIILEHRNIVEFTYRGVVIWTETPANILKITLQNTSGDFIQTWWNISSYFNIWKHYVITYDGTESETGFKLYINGSIQSILGANETGSYTGLPVINKHLTIGANLSGSLWWKNDLDEIRIYKNAEFSAAQIQDMYDFYMYEVCSSSSSSSSIGPPLSYWPDDPHNDKLIGHWTFDQDEDPIDRSGQGNDMILGNNPIHQIKGGAFPCAYGHYNFDGVDDYIQSENYFPAMTDGDDLPFTVSFWYKFDPTSDNILISQGGGGGWSIRQQNPTSLIFQLWHSLGAYKLAVDWDVSSYLQQWTHYVFTYDGSKDWTGFNLYINGSLISINNSIDFTYDRLPDGLYDLKTGTFKDDFDELRIYKNVEFSAVQVQDMHDFYMYEICSPLSYWPDDPHSNKLITHWTFENDEDPPDYSGFGNDAELVNNPTHQTAAGAFPCAEGHYNFDGVDDYIQTKNYFPAMTDGVNDLPFTVSFWYKFDPTADIIISSERAAGGQWSIYQSGSHFIIFKISSSAGSYFYVSYQVTSYVQQWTHYVFTYDGSKDYNGLNLYVNGALGFHDDDSSNGYTNLPDGLYDLKTGTFKDDFDEVRIYRNIEFSEAQAKDMYDFYIDDVCSSSSSAI